MIKDKYAVIWDSLPAWVDQTMYPEMRVFSEKVDAQNHKAEHPLGKFAAVIPWSDSL